MSDKDKAKVFDLTAYKENKDPCREELNTLKQFHDRALSDTKKTLEWFDSDEYKDAVHKGHINELAVPGFKKTLEATAKMVEESIDSESELEELVFLASSSRKPSVENARVYTFTCDCGSTKLKYERKFTKRDLYMQTLDCECGESGYEDVTALCQYGIDDMITEYEYETIKRFMAAERTYFEVASGKEWGYTDNVGRYVYAGEVSGDAVREGEELEVYCDGCYDKAEARDWHDPQLIDPDNFGTEEEHVTCAQCGKVIPFEWQGNRILRVGRE